MGTGQESCTACRGGLPFAFTMAFQPIVDVQERRIDAFEALVRGPDGQGAAQVLGQLTEQNRYPFDQACRVRAIEMAAMLGMPCRLNINFLPNAVYEPLACLNTTLAAARRTGFSTDRLTFEIVEHEDVADEEHLLRIIGAYRRQGFQIALDDFGHGYSGLARLVTLRPDIVKLDRALVQNCDSDPVRLAVVASIVRLGREIGCKVVVEGMESRREVEALRSVGARYMQGYFFARPAVGALVSEGTIWGAH